MKFIKYTDNAKIEKYVSEIGEITFITTRDAIKLTRSRHSGRGQYIQELLQAGYIRATKAKAGA